MTDTLHQAARGYLEHLKGEGKKERTLYTYGKDFEQIEAFFGANRKLAGILAPHVGKFFRSDVLLKLPSGKERSRVRPDCRKVQESGFRPEGGSRFPDEPFELSGAQARAPGVFPQPSKTAVWIQSTDQARAPGVFPQPSKTAVWTQSTDIKGIKPIGRLSDSVR